MQKYFITTPIFYVNAKPHIGHVYSALLADVQSRYQKLKNRQTFFVTGTDEHGLKIQQAAAKQNMKISDFCNQNSSEFKKTFENFSIESDDFIRTTEQRHVQAVQHFWTHLHNQGYLAKKTYQSWYCVQDESFLTAHQIDQDKMISLESGHPVEWAEEENYVFPLEPFRESISKWSQTAIQPSIFQKSLKQFLANPIPDLSVSRCSSRLSWGVPVPNDPSQTIYVWLDALINYLSVINYPIKTTWPPNVQVIGKDILKFHGVYWPAFLLAAKLELPERIHVHSHWTINDEKMSKSKGNVLDPNDLAEKSGHDGLRYFLLKHGVPHSDGNFSHEQLINSLNNDLANTLGNLVNRITAKSVNLEQSFYDNSMILESKESELLRTCLQDLAQVDGHYEDFNYHLVIEKVMECLRQVNNLVQVEQPWTLTKSGELQKLASILNLCLNSVRICSIWLQPIIPTLTDKILNKLNIPTDQRSLEHVHCHVNDLKIQSEKFVLFKKL